jgi:hypothetical protein
MSDEPTRRPRPRPRPSADTGADEPVLLDKAAAEPDTSDAVAAEVSGSDGPEQDSPEQAVRPARPDRARRLAWPIAAAALLLAWVMVGITVWQSHGVWWGKQSSASAAKQSEQVLASAKSCIAAMNTYDYRKLDEARKKALACTTGSFTQTYTQAFDSQIAKLAPQAKATQTFEVASAGVAADGTGNPKVSTDGKEWTVLVFGQITTTNTTTGTQPRYSVLSALVTMKPSGNRWLVAGYRTSP